MFTLSNQTPYAAERTLTTDRDGADVWIVAVKGAFTILPDGTTKVADEQEQICAFPLHQGDPATSSLKYECDLDFTKPTTDVLLHGSAYAPNGKPAAAVDVMMKVDSIVKKLRVVGDRAWKEGVMGLRLTEPEPFVTMPLVYERAYGGTDVRSDDPKRRGWEPYNPVGTGFTSDGRAVAGQRAPNIEPLAPTGRGKSADRVAGFGPIARHWLPRVPFAGTYDLHWEKTRMPLFPKDFDDRFFQCAPEDQRTARYLRGREDVELYNLTPDGRLAFRLPRVALRFVTILAGRRIHHRANLHTVVLEPDVPRVLMVWHTSVPCRGEKLRLVDTTIIEKPCLN